MADAVPAASAAVPNRAYPYNSTVQVGALLPDGLSHLGSGVLVAPDEVLTCAHLVWQQGVGQEVGAFVQPAVNGADEPYGVVKVANVHFFPINDAGGLVSGADSQRDFALLHLSQPVGAGTMPLEPNFPGGPIHVTGYPGGDTTMVDLATNAPRALDASVLVFGQPVAPGTSGGPLWHTGASGQPSCVGVVSTTGWGGEITPEILNTIQTWEAQDHAPAMAGAPAAAAPGSTPSATLPAAAAPGTSPALDALVRALPASDVLRDVTSGLLGAAARPPRAGGGTAVLDQNPSAIRGAFMLDLPSHTSSWNCPEIGGMRTGAI